MGENLWARKGLIVAIAREYTAILFRVETGALGAMMEQEIREQPHRLTEAAGAMESALRAMPFGDYKQIVLVARGSSDNAALYFRYLAEVFLGIPAILAAPSVATVYGREVRYEDALCVAISQSGESPDVRAIVEQMRRQGHATLAVTNSVDSPLAGEAEFHLELGAGPELSIAATKTYTASLLAAYAIVRRLGADLPDAELPTAEWLSHCEAAAESAINAVTEAEVVVALARGFSFSTAQETALKLIECARIPCKSYSTADFAHGPRAIAGPETTAIVFGDVPAGLGDTGCQLIRPPDAGSGPDAPIREIVFSQSLALLAARSKGIDPDFAPNLSKVTRTY
ncbi:MAG: SIS domain-containing protein [Fimbriimonadales bacterium]